MRAEIYIEDADPIGADVRFVFLDGFDAKSPAHQMANILRKHLDGMASRGELTPLSERSIGDVSETDAQPALSGNL